MKNKERLIYLLFAISVLFFTIKSNNKINSLQKENKRLEYTNKELINSIEVLNTELNNAYDCDCGFFEDFYYEEADKNNESPAELN